MMILRKVKELTKSIKGNKPDKYILVKQVKMKDTEELNNAKNSK